MNKLFLYGLAAALAIGLVGGILVMTGGDDQDKTTIADDKAVTEGPQTAEPDGETADPAEAIVPPSFDVVRVNPRGDAVIAGRAHPGSTVIIKDGDKVLGEVQADERGEWVFLPDEPLKPGSRQLSLEMRIDGKDPVLSETVVVVSVPEPGMTLDGEKAGKGSGALAVEMRRGGDGPSRVLQEPSPKAAKELAIAIKTVDYDRDGKLIITGTTDAGGLVQLYLNETFLGRATADDKGLWSLTPQDPIPAGVYDLRADRVDDEGRVLARASTPFRQDPNIPDMDAGTFVVVQPGHSLWRIARKSYGSGYDYTVIYQANQGQIKDPDLIYPGQVFSLPTTDKP